MLAWGYTIDQTDWRASGDYNNAAGTGCWCNTAYAAIATNYAALANTGGGAAHPNVQPSIAFTTMIKT